MNFPKKLWMQINSICISKKYIAIASRPSLLFYFICIQIRIWLYQSQARLSTDCLIVVCTSRWRHIPWHDMTTAWRRIINMFLIQHDLTSSSPPFWREWWFVMSRRVGEQREKWSEVCWKFCKSALGLILYGDSSSNSKRLSIVKHPTQKSQEKIFNRKLGISLKLLI